MNTERRPRFRASKGELEALLAEGQTYAGIARLHGVRPDQVRTRCIGLRLSPSTTNGKIPDDSVLRFALSAVDIPISKIAAAWGVDADHLARAARRRGLPTDRAGRAVLRAELEEARL